ncbi:MAG: hypothetical protein RIC56_22860 [Pseudomonadales bacterium]
MTRERALEIQAGVYAFLAGLFGIVTVALADLPLWSFGVPVVAAMVMVPGMVTNYLTRE